MAGTALILRSRPDMDRAELTLEGPLARCLAEMVTTCADRLVPLCLSLWFTPHAADSGRGVLELRADVLGLRVEPASAPPLPYDVN